MTTAQKLRKLRMLRGLTQPDLALKAGIPTNYISHMETGKILPLGEWDARNREALGWTPEIDAQLEALQETDA